MAIHLTEPEMQGLARVQRLLLSPFAFPDVAAWGRACAEAWRRLIGADLAGLNLPLDSGLQPFNTDPGLDVALQEYAEHFWQVDEGLQQRRLVLDDPNVFHETDLFQVEELERDEVFVDWRIPHRLFEPRSIVVDGDYMVPPILIAYREKNDRRHLLEPKRDLAKLVAPCFEAAAAFWFRGHRLRSRLEPLLNTLDHGVLVYDESRRLRWANEVATRLLEELPEPQPLQAATTRMAGAVLHPTQVALPSAEVVQGVQLRALLLPPGAAGVGPMAVVMLEDQREHLPSVEEVQQRHDLTPRQSEVALLMARRLSHKEIAKRLGIRPNTARRHCQAVLQRLRVHRREEVRGRVVEFPSLDTG